MTWKFFQAVPPLFDWQLPSPNPLRSEKDRASSSSIRSACFPGRVTVMSLCPLSHSQHMPHDFWQLGRKQTWGCCIRYTLHIPADLVHPPVLSPKSSGPPCLQPRALTGKTGGSLTFGTSIFVLRERGVHPHPFHETQPVSGGRREGGGGGRFPLSLGDNGRLRRNSGRSIDAIFFF